MMQTRDDPANRGRIEAAVALLRRRLAESPGTPLARLAVQAVDSIFCAQVAFGSDAVACRVAEVEAALAAEITRRALQPDVGPCHSGSGDCLTTPADQSFPARDWPARAWGGPTREEEHSSRPNPTSNGERR
jgi:DNA-binding transcriptional regulator YdaS (Cro superfamily)